ncbi:MAG: DUF2934 domain-containing protein, partial [Terracidiphilus sp.]
ISTWEAAVTLATGRRIGVCKKCGNELEYRIEHANAGESDGENSFVVTRAVRLGPKMQGHEGIDSFLLVLREIGTGAERILPTYWSYGQDVPQRGGQFPPLLSISEWKTLFRALYATFERLDDRIRLRAYELYEQRGSLPGSALEDWLQAEAELTGWQVLRAA